MTTTPPATGDLLRDAGRSLLVAVSDATAMYSAFREDWQSEHAERARDHVCEALNAIDRDEEFWQALQSATPREPDPYLVERLKGLDLGSFEELEQGLLEDSGVEPSLAAAWANATSDLIRFVRVTMEDPLPPSAWLNVDSTRSHVGLAVEKLCVERVQIRVSSVVDLPPEEVTQVAHRNKRNSKRFRRILWGAIRLGSGVGVASLNLSVALGSIALPPAIPAGVFGFGSVLGTIGNIAGGGEALHEAASMSDDDDG